MKADYESLRCRSGLFSILPKDSSMCSRRDLGIEPPNLPLADDPLYLLSHSQCTYSQRTWRESQGTIWSVSLNQLSSDVTSDVMMSSDMGQWLSWCCWIVVQLLMLLITSRHRSTGWVFLAESWSGSFAVSQDNTFSKHCEPGATSGLVLTVNRFAFSDLSYISLISPASPGATMALHLLLPNMTSPTHLCCSLCLLWMLIMLKKKVPPTTFWFFCALKLMILAFISL